MGIQVRKKKEVGFGYDSKIPGEDTWAPCVFFALRIELTGFGALFGSLLLSAQRISGYFFY